MRFPWNWREADLERELAHHLHELTAEYERQRALSRGGAVYGEA